MIFVKAADNFEITEQKNTPILVTANNRISPVNLSMKSRYVDTIQEITTVHLAVSLHSHDFFEVLYCRNPADVEYLVGAERYRLQKGDIVFIPPGVPHCPILPERMPESYRRDVIRMSKEFVANMFSLDISEGTEDLPGSFLLRTAGTRWDHLGELFHQGNLEAEEKQTGWELALIANTTKLMVYLHRALNEQSTAPLKAEKPELLDQVLEYIDQHLHEKITLSEVAHHFYVSQSTITQTFRNKLGLSFYRCVTQGRLIAAKRLIEGDQSLESIAEAVGFTDYSAFYRAFKQEYGISPRQYRINHNQTAR